MKDRVDPSEIDPADDLDGPEPDHDHRDDADDGLDTAAPAEADETQADQGESDAAEADDAGADADPADAEADDAGAGHDELDQWLDGSSPDRESSVVPDGLVGAAAAAKPRRLNRWDRPEPHHDWRYFVGMLGRTLIVIGILMFGFVGYQLWGTGLATARAQDRLGDEFAEVIATATPDAPATVAPSTTDLPPASSVPATTPVEPSATTEPDTEPVDPPVTSAPDEPDTPATSLVPVEQEIPEILAGKALAKLEIPRMGKEGGDALLVVPGVDLDSLQQGPGHYPDTPLPGQLGNAAIAGHRTTWGEPFARIDELVPGDEIIVTMLTGDRFVYVVASTEIVSPRDYHVVQTTDPTVAELTLTSCHPRWSARQRIVVHAFLQPEDSAPVGTPTFYDLEANDRDRDAPTGDDPAVTAPGETTTDTDPDTGTDTGSDGATTDTEASTDGDSTDGGGAIDGQQGPDGLTAGWFHDSAAWPQIALWGALCALVAVIAYRISRRFRNYAIGWSIAIVPFAIALYFLYQNVNRLLPPGL